MHERSGIRSRGNPGNENGKDASRKPLWGRIEKTWKEETESWVAGSWTEADERKQKWDGQYGRRKLEVSTWGTAVGANQGRVKRNIQWVWVPEPWRDAWEIRQKVTGKTNEAKAEFEHWWSHCETESGRWGKARNRGWVVRIQNWRRRKNAKTAEDRKKKQCDANRKVESPVIVRNESGWQGWVGGSSCRDWIRWKTKGNCR